MVPAQSLKKTAILTGPTATGKTALALEMISPDQIEIINADSLLVFNGMDIGTAKPSPQELTRIPHHLIDIREPHESFTAGDFYRNALACLDEIESRGKRGLIVGGTGFYLKALLYGLWDAPASDPALRAELDQLENSALYAELQKRDPESALRIGINDRYRLTRAVEMIRLSGKSPSELQAEANTQVNPRFELWVIDRANEELYPRISARTQAMLHDGLIEETKRLLARYPDVRPRPLTSVGYAETCAYLEGRSPEGRKIRNGIEGLQDEIALSTRQLVKRQRTWFRGEKAAQWFTLDADLAAFKERWKNLYGR